MVFTAEKCMFSEGDFSKISSGFLCFWNKWNKKQHRGYLGLSLRIGATSLGKLMEHIMFEVLPEINIV